MRGFSGTRAATGEPSLLDRMSDGDPDGDFEDDDLLAEDREEEERTLLSSSSDESRMANPDMVVLVGPKQKKKNKSEK